jgi:hypothetical protein
MKCVSVCEYKAISPIDKTLHTINHGTRRSVLPLSSDDQLLSQDTFSRTYFHEIDPFV